jgi:hypothetical protein
MYSNGYAPFDPNDPAARTRWFAPAENPPSCDGHSLPVDASGRIIVMTDASPGIMLAMSLSQLSSAGWSAKEGSR